MSYVDGYVIPIRKNKIKEYVPMARLGKKMWLKFGALDYKECIGDDLGNKFGVSFSKLAKAKAGETVIFAFIVYKNKIDAEQAIKDLNGRYFLKLFTI
jgi:alkaline phosphatase